VRQQNGFHLEYELTRAHQAQMRDERSSDRLAQQATTEAVAGRRLEVWTHGIPLLSRPNFGRILRNHLTSSS
jgi:hypothetical protein